MNMFKRCLLCVLALLLVFGAWYIADPQMALLQAPDAEHSPRALYRLIPYFSYIASVWITWLTTAPPPHIPPLIP